MLLFNTFAQINAFMIIIDIYRNSCYFYLKTNPLKRSNISFKLNFSKHFLLDVFSNKSMIKYLRNESLLKM